MHVVTGRHALHAKRAFRAKSQQLIGARDVFSRRELAVCFRAFDQSNVETEPLRDAGIVGEGRACLLRRGAMRGEDRIEAEALRRLRAPKLLARQRAGHATILRHCQSVRHGHAGEGGLMLVEARDDAGNE